MPLVDRDDITAKQIAKKPSFEITKKYTNKIKKINIIPRCKSSLCSLNVNSFFIILNKIKKLKIGNKSVIEVVKIFVLLFSISDNVFVGRNPPDEIVVKAKLNESKSLIPAKVYKNIINKVEKK